MSDLPMLHVYGDESSQTAHRFMTLGCIVLSDGDVPLFVRAIQSRRSPAFRSQEIKWTKVNAAILPDYIKIVDCFFDLQAQDRVHFHSVSVDCHDLDHSTYNSGDAELGFNKFNYQLLLKIGTLYGKSQRLYVYLDQRTTVHDPAKLMEIVNFGLRKRRGIETFPIRRCVFIPSKKSILVQVADLLTGAISFHRNRHDSQPGANYAKIRLASYIAAKLKRQRLTGTTPLSEKRFTLWEFALRKRGGSRA